MRSTLRSIPFWFAALLLLAAWSESRCTLSDEKGKEVFSCGAGRKEYLDSGK